MTDLSDFIRIEHEPMERALRKRISDQADALRDLRVERSLALDVMTENQRTEFHRIVAAREASSPACSPLCPCGHPASSHPAVWAIAGDATTHCNECECRDYDGEPT